MSAAEGPGQHLVITVTGAAGRIAYSLLPSLCSGEVFGNHITIDLQLLDIVESYHILEGMKMEIDDSAFDLVKKVVITTNPREAFANADYAIILGGYPRKQGMERKDLIAINTKIIYHQALAINEFAKKSVKVIVIANPANTNCLIAQRAASSIPKENFSCLMRLDHQRLLGFLAKKLTSLGYEVNSSAQIRHVAIFGNHSTTQVPHVTNGQVLINQSWVDIATLIDKTWLFEELPRLLQGRGGEIIRAQKASSALSAARAIVKHLQDLAGSPGSSAEDNPFSIGILGTSNPYNFPEDIFMSYPCTRDGNTGNLVICGDYELTEEYTAMIQKTIQELVDESKEAMAALEAL